MSELIERLMLVREYHCMMYEQYDTVTEAAATITALQAELAEAREVPGRIAEYLRDPHTVTGNMELWISKTKAGFMTSRTKGDLGIAAWFARNAATAIEARDWTKP